MVAPSRGWGDKIGASGGNRGRPGPGGGFNRGAQRREDWQGNPVAPNKFETKIGKRAEGGKPGEDNISVAQTLINTKPLTEVEKAVLEAQRQRALLSTGVKVGSALAPSLIGPGLTLGNYMGKLTEEDAALNPGNYRTDPKDPGSLFSKSGPVNTNRAVTGPAARTENTNTEKKKKQQLPTLLGASANPLGTFSNPVMIT